MKLLILESSLRLGNEIILLMNAIVYGLQNNFLKIIVPEYEFLNSTEILINDNIHDKENIIYEKISTGSLFYATIYDRDSLQTLVFHLPHRYVYEKYLEKYINIDTNTDTIDMTLFTRSEDVFQQKQATQKQPSLYFYKKSMQLEAKEKCLLISHDLLNPVSNYLYNNQHVDWKPQEWRTDITAILNSESLAFGLSSLIYFVVLASKKLKRLYYPKIAWDDVVKFHTDIFNFKIEDILNTDQELILIDHPDYPYYQNNEHTPEAYDQMINYFPKEENIIRIKGKYTCN